jgi:hypothetical protein
MTGALAGAPAIAWFVAPPLDAARVPLLLLPGGYVAAIRAGRDAGRVTWPPRRWRSSP